MNHHKESQTKKSPTKFRYRTFIQAVLLPLLFSSVYVIGLQNQANANTEKMAPFPPISNQTPVLSNTQLIQSTTSPKVNNPLQNAFISAIPDLDGRDVFISVTGVNRAESGLRFNIDAGVGGGSYRESYAMTLSDTTYLAVAMGFAAGEDVSGDDDTISITTTVGSDIVSTGDIKFQRAFVQPSQTEMMSIDNGGFVLELLNTNSVSADTYVLAMSTNVQPGTLPDGHAWASKSYGLRAAGSLTQSQKFMTLNLRFNEPLLNNRDPHTLAIMRWDAVHSQWDNLGGTLLNDSNFVTLPIKQFDIYGLAATTTWHDTFPEASLSGVSSLNNTLRGPGQAIILNNVLSGSVTSIPITPTTATHWGTLTFSATQTSNTVVTIDVLDLNDQPLLSNISDGTDLDNAGLSIANHPSVKLRANLSTNSLGQTPHLHAWSLSWLSVSRKVYLPLVLK
ncbi:MAG: hypothetical protein AAF629_01100 [Chloroflexota bacterium]